MTTPKTKHSGYERDEHDWYLEPAWCTEMLCRHVTFKGSIHDPACGIGTILNVLKHEGYVVTGCDIVDREWQYMYPPRDYLLVSTHTHDNIVTNSPYSLAEAFARHAIKHTRGKIALLTRLDFLASQKRYPLFTEHPPSLVLVLSQRPSMPPGWRDVEAKDGMNDYCWIVWEGNNHGMVVTDLEWAKPLSERDP